MPNKHDDEFDSVEFSLEAILAEFGSHGSAAAEEPPAEPPQAKVQKVEPEKTEGKRAEPRKAPPSKAQARKADARKPRPGEARPADWRENTIPFPVRKAVRPPEPDDEEPAEDRPDGDETKVLEFPPQAPENPVAAGIDKLRKKADDFAGHMYEEAGTEQAPEVRKAEKYIPGVDEEEAPPVRERKPRREAPPPPDLPAAELTKRYGRGLKGLRVRTALVFFLTVCLTGLTVVKEIPFLPAEAAAVLNDPSLRCYILSCFHTAALLLGSDAVLRGLVKPFRLRTGMDTVTALANLAVLADALTLPALSGGNPRREPLCAAACLCLWCAMWGELQKRRGQRLACHTAASAAEPYLVTRDEGAWNGKDTYAKWSGAPAGFGSQIQDLDGAERIYRAVVPVILIACFLFALISSLGRNRPEDLLWCLGAILTGASSLSSTLAFGQPWRRMSKRLSKSGAALAGWRGVTGTTGGSNLLLTDTDLFPAGSVKLNGVKIFGSFPADTVVADAATVIRDAGCGLEKVFHDLLRGQGAVYRRGEGFTAYESGGYSENIRGEQVLVGSSSFMVMMEVALPQGLNVKNAVFCAIDGELAGIFALSYSLPGTVAPAIDSLLRSHITPVLCTRDFNLIPSMLRTRFKLPSDKLEYPPVERRRELSDEGREHSDTLTAVLCREGIGPYADAVVGGRRLRAAVRLSAAFSCIGAVVGALLCFYLTFVAAYGSLTVANLMVFLLMWLVPTPLISGWVDRY